MFETLDAKEICRLASEALASSGVSEIRRLSVHQEHDTLKMSGTVASFYHKQLALETVRGVSRGMSILNRVQVD